MLDFSNAFGSVDHNRLLQVLKSVGISGESMQWFKSFLNGCQQTVKHEEKISRPQTIKRGIIQGENNSQLLFSVYINNITKYIKTCIIIMFADDIQLYIECDIDEIHKRKRNNEQRTKIIWQI